VDRQKVACRQSRWQCLSLSSTGQQSSECNTGWIIELQVVDDDKDHTPCRHHRIHVLTTGPASDHTNRLSSVAIVWRPCVLQCTRSSRSSNARYSEETRQSGRKTAAPAGAAPTHPAASIDGRSPPRRRRNGNEIGFGRRSMQASTASALCTVMIWLDAAAAAAAECWYLTICIVRRRGQSPADAFVKLVLASSANDSDGGASIACLLLCLRFSRRRHLDLVLTKNT